jgi:TolB-like protein
VGILGLALWLTAYAFDGGGGALSGRRPAEASIAIVPFVDLSDDERNDLFAAGLTEELLTELSRLRGLRVAERGSARGTRASAGAPGTDPREIARTLNVATVLSGTVRRDSIRVVVTAQLDDADGFQVWAQQFSRPVSDAIAIQDEIAREIADALGLSLLPEEMARLNEQGTIDARAYDDYLKGLAEFAARSRSSLHAAIAHFQSAVDRDPLYAEAHAGLAQASYLLPLFDPTIPGDAMAERAHAAARRALELDPRSAEAYAALGGVAYQSEWRMEEAEEALRRAISLSPSYVTAHQWLAETQFVQGELEPALASIDRATELDPTSPVVRLMKGFMLEYAGRLELADQQFREALRLDPAFSFALYYYPDLLVAMGRYDEARAMAERAAATYFADDPGAGSAWLRGILLYIDATEDPSRADASRAYWAEYRRDSDIFWRFLALAKAGAVEDALASLRRMRAERHPSFVWMPSRLRLEPELLSDPRVTAVFREAGLPVLPPVEPPGP